MKASKLFLLGTLVLALFMAVPAIAGIPNLPFTGDVEADFPPGPGILIIRDPGTAITDPPVPEGKDVIVEGQPSDADNPPGFNPGSGWDIKDLRLAYDAGSDTLYVGLNSFNIVGDADGDGNPAGKTWGGGDDNPDISGGESIAVYFDLDMKPDTFDNDYSWDVIVGVCNVGDISTFRIANFVKGSFSPPGNFGTPISGHDGLTPINPGTTEDANDWEFSITNFSTLALDAGIIGGDPNLGALRVGASMGSSDDGAIVDDYNYYHQIPSTIVTIDASDIEGGTVNLTVTELNDSEALRGQEDGPDGPTIPQPLPFHNVQVEVTQNGSPLDILTPPPDDGDTSDLGVLNVGETWLWTKFSVAISATTTFVATGSGVGPAGFVHTYLEDPDEQDSVTVTVPVTGGDTTVDIKANDSDDPITVCEGNTVTLTICEENTGNVNLVDVFVELSENGVPTGEILIYPPDRGDDGNGILEPGEVWCWDVNEVVDVITTYDAIGHGIDPSGEDITPPVYPLEYDEVTVNTEECSGGEGCLPGFWENNARKHGASAWCDRFSPSMLFSDVFSLNEPLTIRSEGNSTITNPTLLQALGANGGGVNAMVRHGVAAMLNACSDCVQYEYSSPDQVIFMIENALNGAPGAYTVGELHSMFAENNEAVCPVNQHGDRVGEGCTPGFWKNTGEKYNASGWECFKPETRFSDVFLLSEPLTIRGKGKKTITDPTLLQALGAEGDGIDAMVRHGVAAMLNACSGCVQYAIGGPEQVISMIENTLNGAPGAHTVDELHSMFAEYNEAGCPVNQQGDCVGVEED